MDFLALLGVNFYLRRQKKWTHLLGTALLFSAAGLILLLWVNNTWIYNLTSHFFLNTAMVLFAFGYMGKRYFLENWAAAYFIVILSGGIFQWITPFLMPFLGFMGIAAAAGFLGYLFLSALLARGRRGSHIYPAQLHAGGKTLLVQAYWDSGNQLTDPYTGQIVHILSDEKLDELFPEKNIMFRYVPFRSLGEEHGLIRVINVDELLVFDEKQVIRLESAAIGIAEKDLFEKKEYELILHASVL